METTILSLPDDILLYILNQLDLRSILMFLSSSTNASKINHILWNNFAKKMYHVDISKLKHPKASLKALYEEEQDRLHPDRVQLRHNEARNRLIKRRHFLLHLLYCSTRHPLWECLFCLNLLLFFVFLPLHIQHVEGWPTSVMGVLLFILTFQYFLVFLGSSLVSFFFYWFFYDNDDDKEIKIDIGLLAPASMSLWAGFNGRRFSFWSYVLQMTAGLCFAVLLSCKVGGWYDLEWKMLGIPLMCFCSLSYYWFFPINSFIQSGFFYLLYVSTFGCCLIIVIGVSLSLIKSISTVIGLMMTVMCVVYFLLSFLLGTEVKFEWRLMILWFGLCGTTFLALILVYSEDVAKDLGTKVVIRSFWLVYIPVYVWLLVMMVGWFLIYWGVFRFDRRRQYTRVTE